MTMRREKPEWSPTLDLIAQHEESMRTFKEEVTARLHDLYAQLAEEARVLFEEHRS